jgi:hypothetical protein
LDPLCPADVLDAQVLVELEQRPPLEDLGRRDVALGQPARRQQFPQELGVGLVFSELKMIKKSGWRCDGAAGDVREGRYAETDRSSAAGDLVHLGKFGPGAGQAHLEAFGFAEPAVLFGLGDARGQVAADLHQVGSLSGVGAQQQASQTRLTEMILLDWTQASPRQLFTESAQKVCCRRDLGRVAEVDRSSHGRRK